MKVGSCKEKRWNTIGRKAHVTPYYKYTGMFPKKLCGVWVVELNSLGFGIS
jgi:hypothetical protein